MRFSTLCFILAAAFCAACTADILDAPAPEDPGVAMSIDQPADVLSTVAQISPERLEVLLNAEELSAFCDSLADATASMSGGDQFLMNLNEQEPNSRTTAAGWTLYLGEASATLDGDLCRPESAAGDGYVSGDGICVGAAVASLGVLPEY